MDPRIHRRVQPEKSTPELIVDLLNEAQSNDDIKVENLCKAQEIVLNKAPHLLNAYLDEIQQFIVDKSADVRSTIAAFIESAGYDTPLVCKRAIRASGKILRATLKWAANATVVTPEMETAWTQITSLKIQIINMIDGDNDGIRMQAIKFLEGVVLIQTYPDPDIPKQPNDFSLEDVPLTLKIARRRNLEEEANHVMDLLIKIFCSQHVTCINLMTCMGSVSIIAKSRPQFMTGVLEALCKVQTHLPPTLSESSIMSVNKQLKRTLLNLLKHPASIEHVSMLAQQLTQLGVKEQEILKSYPKAEDIRRVKKKQQEVTAAIAAKRAKVEPIMGVIDEIDPGPPNLPELIELSDSYIADRLNVEIATELVMDSMAWVPDTMPSIFQREYQPTESTDLVIQRKTIGKLLAAQIKVATSRKMKKDSKDERLMEDLIRNPSISVAEVKRERKREKDREKEREAKAALEAHEKSLANARSRLKYMKFSEITKPLVNDVKERMLMSSINRILLADKTAICAGVANVRSKIITTMAVTYNHCVKESILRYITSDIKNRFNLAIGWLYEEYALLQGFQRRTVVCSKPKEAPHQSYNFLLCTLVSAIELIHGNDRDTLLSRLYLEAPLITEDAVEALKSVSSKEMRGLKPLHLLKELVIRRPTKQLVFLNVLLCHTGHENNVIRDQAVQIVVELYTRKELCKLIEEYAVLYLGFLRLPNPPEIVFGQDRGRPKVQELWTESTARACFSLYLALLSMQKDLILELARLYSSMGDDIKRIVLRLVEGPIHSLGMASPQLLSLVENCPKGAETLVSRIIHILTEKSPPSSELISRVRELYQTRIADVRLLIPVLNGLTKKEVIDALPKLIKLNPAAMKEVFNRLLKMRNDNGSSTATHTSPITPAELLIALHTIDPSKAEIKTIIKATSLCLADKEIYTQEIVAVVVRHLMEIVPLPTLLMRTVIQSLSSHPRLSGFVLNVLQCLITKQVWKQPKVWEGFVKCCERMQPQSFAVILQLPPPQLAEALKISPNLTAPLLQHIESFSDNQKAHIPQWIMDVIKSQKPVVSHDEYDIAPLDDFPVKSKNPTETDLLEPPPPGLD